MLAVRFVAAFFLAVLADRLGVRLLPDVGKQTLVIRAAF